MTEDNRRKILGPESLVVGFISILPIPRCLPIRTLFTLDLSYKTV